MAEPVQGGKFTYFDRNMDYTTTKTVKGMNVEISAPHFGSKATVVNGKTTAERTTGDGDKKPGFRFTTAQTSVFEKVCGLDGNPEDLSKKDLEALKAQKGIVSTGNPYSKYKVSVDENNKITLNLYDDRTKACPDENITLNVLY